MTLIKATEQDTDIIYCSIKSDQTIYEIYDIGTRGHKKTFWNRRFYINVLLNRLY